MIVRRLESFAVGALIAVCLVGLSVQVLSMPIVTSVLVRAVDSATGTGMTEEATLTTAETVRAYVADREQPEPLPATVEGREGFSARAVKHLDDVRVVMAATRWVTIALGLAVAIWLLVRYVQREPAPVVSACRAAGYILVLTPALLGAAALIDFDTFFTYFHKPLFYGDTWLFPANELLVQLFPEPFWMASGGLLVGLTLVAAAALLLFAKLIGRLSAKSDQR